MALVRVLQRHRTNRINTEIYYKGLIHTIMEAEKSHDLWPISWRPRKAVSPEGLRTRGANGVKS